jgi:Ion channel
MSKLVLRIISEGLVGRMLVGALSITRVAAQWLMDKNYIRNFQTMLAWNSLYYIIMGVSYIIIMLWPDILGRTGLWGLIILCVTRVNELVFAFYGDALPKQGSVKKRLPLGKRDRIILLTLAYIEIIFQFGIIYVAIDGLYAGEKPFHAKFEAAWDAIFLSGATITTLGAGDFYPTKPCARFAVLYEALIGILFIALGLAAYMSGSEKSEGAP